MKWPSLGRWMENFVFLAYPYVLYIYIYVLYVHNPGNALNILWTQLKKEMFTLKKQP